MSDRPPPRWWRGIDLSTAPTDTPVAIGGAVDPETFLDALDHGVSVLPTELPAVTSYNRWKFHAAVDSGSISVLSGGSDPYSCLWWCPDPRMATAPQTVHLWSKARRAIRRNQLVTTVDAAFPEVLERCREAHWPTWLTPDMMATYHELFARGVSFSSEVWRGDRLLAGAIGTCRGSVVSIDTLFHQEPEMSRVAAADIARRCQDSGYHYLDFQVDSPFASSLRVGSMRRAEFLTLVGGTRPPSLPKQPLAAERLLPPD
ncbi:hypothetical protein [Kribbella solani]|uniref:Leucyl/phenylalanyl-tRNA--protein transferase n=1 Tax=Kribbella solani TaxID=236067 RepID=A0A841DFC3_9ACTN|nr:leucyl/phenylalanyl-tRNA--protein transferase [Kribbella solani]